MFRDSPAPEGIFQTITFLKADKKNQKKPAIEIKRFLAGERVIRKIPCICLPGGQVFAMRKS